MPAARGVSIRPIAGSAECRCRRWPRWRARSWCWRAGVLRIERGVAVAAGACRRRRSGRVPRHSPHPPRATGQNSRWSALASARHRSSRWHAVSRAPRLPSASGAWPPPANRARAGSAARQPGQRPGLPARPRQRHRVEGRMQQGAQAAAARPGGVVVQRRADAAPGIHVGRQRDDAGKGAPRAVRPGAHRAAAVGHAHGEHRACWRSRSAVCRERRRSAAPAELRRLQHVAVPVGFRVVAGMQVLHRHRVRWRRARRRFELQASPRAPRVPSKTSRRCRCRRRNSPCPRPLSV